jgi:hypothetical protein
LKSFFSFFHFSFFPFFPASPNFLPWALGLPGRNGCLEFFSIVFCVAGVVVMLFCGAAVMLLKMIL